MRYTQKICGVGTCERHRRSAAHNGAHAKMRILLISCNDATGHRRVRRSLPSWERVGDVEVLPCVRGATLDVADARVSHVARLRIATAIADSRVMRELAYRPMQDIVETTNQVGCALSHVAAWQRIASSNQSAMVVEDDTIYSGTDGVDVRAAIMREPDAAFVSICNISNLKTPTLAAGAEHFYGTQAYYITPVGARYLLDGALPVVQHVDRYIASRVLTDDRRDFRVALPRLTTVSTPRLGASTLDHAGRGFYVLSASSMLIVISSVVVAVVFARRAVACERDSGRAIIARA